MILNKPPPPLIVVLIATPPPEDAMPNSYLIKDSDNEDIEV